MAQAHSLYKIVGGVETDSSPVIPLQAGIGSRISDIAKLIGLRRNAAHVMGVSAATLQRYVSEENMPPFDVVARLCSAAGVRMEWLAWGKGPISDSLSHGADMHARMEVREPLQADSASYQARRVDDQLDAALLAKSVRIANDVLTGAGVRHRFNSDEFAEFVRIVFDDLAHGYAENQAAEALGRILSIGSGKETATPPNLPA